VVFRHAVTGQVVTETLQGGVGVD